MRECKVTFMNCNDERTTYDGLYFKKKKEIRVYATEELYAFEDIADVYSIDLFNDMDPQEIITSIETEVTGLFVDYEGKTSIEHLRMTIKLKGE